MTDHLTETRTRPPRSATCYAYTHHRERPCARDGHIKHGISSGVMDEWMALVNP